MLDSTTKLVDLLNRSYSAGDLVDIKALSMGFDSPGSTLNIITKLIKLGYFTKHSAGLYYLANKILICEGEIIPIVWVPSSNGYSFGLYVQKNTL